MASPSPGSGPQGRGKKLPRETFRAAVYQRDGHRCAVCGYQPPAEAWNESTFPLDAHHITDRHQMPLGGYVPENGISLCPRCHLQAEAEHNQQTPAPGYSRRELYARIGSSYAGAYQASLATAVGGDAVWERIVLVLEAEQRLTSMLLVEPDSFLWMLACEELGETDPLVCQFGGTRPG